MENYKDKQKEIKRIKKRGWLVADGSKGQIVRKEDDKLNKKEKKALKKELIKNKLFAQIDSAFPSKDGW